MRSPSPLSRLAFHLRRHGPPALVAGVGGALAIGLLAGLSARLGQALLIAPFGASAVLVFALPESPLAQPRNVIGGHLLSAGVGVAVFALLGSGPLACALGVGLAIALMRLTGTLHPPAGGDPLVVLLGGGAGWSFLLAPVLAGAVTLVVIARAYHRQFARPAEGAGIRKPAD